MQTKQNLELQLHEQYATNSNSILGSMLTLFVTMLAVIGAYGYVFLHASRTMDEAHPYSLTDLIYTATAVTLVLTAIVCLCVCIGYRQRKEQFVIYTIRKRAYEADNSSDEFKSIYPPTYNPFDKGTISAMQFPYDAFFWMSIIAFAAMIISLAIKCLVNAEYAIHFAVGLIAVSVLSSIIYVMCLIHKKHRKYHELEKFYANEKEKGHEKSDIKKLIVEVLSSSSIDLHVSKSDDDIASLLRRKLGSD